MDRPSSLPLCSCLTILKEEPLRETLRFLRDLLSYGSELAPTSDFGVSQPKRNPPEVRDAVKKLFSTYGEQVVQRVFTGMLSSFSENCFLDASAVLVDMFKLDAPSTAKWVNDTLAQLLSGTISDEEKGRLTNNIAQ